MYLLGPNDVICSPILLPLPFQCLCLSFPSVLPSPHLSLPLTLPPSHPLPLSLSSLPPSSLSPLIFSFSSHALTVFFRPPTHGLFLRHFCFIISVRKLAKPPHLIMRIMDCVLLLFQRKIDTVTQDPERPCLKPSWSEAMKLMSASTFLHGLLTFPKVRCQTSFPPRLYYITD